MVRFEEWVWTVKEKDASPAMFGMRTTDDEEEERVGGVGAGSLRRVAAHHR